MKVSKVFNFSIPLLPALVAGPRPWFRSRIYVRYIPNLKIFSSRLQLLEEESLRARDYREGTAGSSPRRSLFAALWASRVVSGRRYFVQHRRTRFTALSRSMLLPTET